MLGSMLRRDRLRLGELVLKRAGEYTSFEEKLYCRILVAGSYLVNNMSLMNSAMWFHFQGIRLPHPSAFRDELAPQSALVLHWPRDTSPADL